MVLYRQERPGVRKGVAVAPGCGLFFERLWLCSFSFLWRAVISLCKQNHYGLYLVNAKKYVTLRSIYNINLLI